MACSVGAAGLCACTISLELAEPQFTQGDLAATSMGLVAHDPWFGPPGGRASARVRNGEGFGFASSRAAADRLYRKAREAREADAEPQAVTLAPNLALSPLPAPGRPQQDQSFAWGLRTGLVPGDRLLLPDLHALARGPANGPAAARPGGRSSGVPGSEGLAAPAPAPPKPFYSAGRTWMPKMKPSDLADASAAI